MKNRKKHTYTYKRMNRRIVAVPTEVKLSKLYCYTCHTYKPIRHFPHETGYGTTKRTICDKCIQRKQEKRAHTRTGLTSKDRVFQHYGGYKCADCGIEKEEVLDLHHVYNNGKECKIEACRRSYQYNKQVYYCWLIRNNYPPKHEQVVLCQNCHILRHSTKSKK